MNKQEAEEMAATLMEYLISKQYKKGESSTANDMLWHQLNQFLGNDIPD